MQMLRDSVACMFFSSTPGTKALFLDYDGTLREFEKRPEAAVPSEEAHEIFHLLNSREDLKVFIVSGRNKEFLEDQFRAYNSFTLIAEHGFTKRGPDTGHKWRPFNPFTDTEWMVKVRIILEFFTRCTPGSHIEEKHSAIVWHYRECDEEYGQFKAKELMHQLATSLGNMPCQISQGSKIVEVASLSVKKGLVVRAAITQQETQSEPFAEVLVMGDDRTDESMFLDAPQGAWTVKVGPGETSAKHRLKGPAEVRRFLRIIADQKLPSTAMSPVSPSSKTPKFFSMDGRKENVSQEDDDADDDPLDCLPETEEPNQM
ncbi:unnamed protein product [Polarella glacialis]|uniref:Trehalose 6-phosphate phosphatase n=1 Tax=Polarella glacialis TaxID=89957 RepID=A0A813EF18_POLGL|nr:unnamed protein product [Polarella glacialis]